mgnify:CR=1 FL=1
MSARGDNGVRVATFFEKRAHFHALAIKVAVVTTETPQSNKLRQWNCIFYVLWMPERTKAVNSYGILLVSSVR